MTDKLNEDLKNELMKSIPINRLGSGEDIANAVLFLASNKSDYITGETIHVNGGMYMA
jgi:3-oxoacyl-[acyl-carrier protein] reductase